MKKGGKSKRDLNRCILIHVRELIIRYFQRANVSLQISRERNPLNFFYIFYNFKNPAVELNVLYVLNIHIKFRSNRILFIIQLMNLFFVYNFLPQKFKI